MKTYECRRCGAEAEEVIFKSKPHLPPDWAEIAARHHNLVTHFVLCPACMTAFWAQVRRLQEIGTVEVVKA